MTMVDPENWKPGDGIQLDHASLESVKSVTSQAIQAGPGAGKTELLAQRAAYLLQTNVCPHPKKILAISFKRDAAKNLKDRVSKRIGGELVGRFDSFTFDAFSKSILDRFRETIPEWVRPLREYEISYPTWDHWRNFGARPNLEAPFSGESFSADKVKSCHGHLGVKTAPFGLNRQLPTTPTEAMTLKWWDLALTSSPPFLTFDMVRTLALTIIHHNPQIRSALLHTYSHVFLDEFQDTTFPQYALIHEIFNTSSAVLTAVGDNKQLIMTFAGATDKRFAQFSQSFAAQNVSLASNFRSNKRIVDIINSVAKNIEENAVKVICSRPNAPLPQVTDGLIQFDSEVEQSQSLAKFISNEVQHSQATPSDFIILVRQKADDHAAELQAAFEQRDLVLRNEARVLGDSGVSLQDITSEPLAQLIVQLVQVAAGDRRRGAYLNLIELLTDTHGSKDERDAAQFYIETNLRETSTALRPYMDEKPYDLHFKGLVEAIVQTLGQDRIRRLARDYRNTSRFENIKSGLVSFLEECAMACDSWEKFVDNFLGVDQVRLMTIHKSKGLEAHTVVFLSLQDESFYYRANVEEEKLAFFVAVSRAEERVFFTKTAKKVSLIAPLYDLLDSANVSLLEDFP